MRTHVWLVVLAVEALCSLPFSVSVAATITSDFRDFKDPLLVTYTLGQVPPGNLTTLGPVKITNSTANVIISAGSYLKGTPSDSANVGGWGATALWLPLILNIDKPVQALGITFDNVGNASGSILSVYNGPNGTGQLIGQIESDRVLPPWSATNQPIDFVGVIDKQGQIRSALLSSYGTDQVRIHAIAVSIPEPSTLILALAAFALITQRCRHLSIT